MHFSWKSILPERVVINEPGTSPPLNLSGFLCHHVATPLSDIASSLSLSPPCCDIGEPHQDARTMLVGLSKHQNSESNKPVFFKSTQSQGFCYSNTKISLMWMRN